MVKKLPRFSFPALHSVTHSACTAAARHTNLLLRYMVVLHGRVNRSSRPPLCVLNKQAF